MRRDHSCFSRGETAAYRVDRNCQRNWVTAPVTLVPVPGSGRCTTGSRLTRGAFGVCFAVLTTLVKFGRTCPSVSRSVRASLLVSPNCGTDNSRDGCPISRVFCEKWGRYGASARLRPRRSALRHCLLLSPPAVVVPGRKSDLFLTPSGQSPTTAGRYLKSRFDSGIFSVRFDRPSPTSRKKREKWGTLVPWARTGIMARYPKLARSRLIMKHLHPIMHLCIRMSALIARSGLVYSYPNP
jgi:hypothetical protein